MVLWKAVPLAAQISDSRPLSQCGQSSQGSAHGPQVWRADVRRVTKFHSDARIQSLLRARAHLVRPSWQSGSGVPVLFPLPGFYLGHLVFGHVCSCLTASCRSLHLLSRWAHRPHFCVSILSTPMTFATKRISGEKNCFPPANGFNFSSDLAGKRRHA